MIRIPPNGPTKSSATGAWSSSGARDTHCYWEILADVLRVIDAPPGTRDEVRDTVLQKNVQVAARIAQEADRIDRNPIYITSIIYIIRDTDGVVAAVSITPHSFDFGVWKMSKTELLDRMSNGTLEVEPSGKRHPCYYE
ncbi:hypothetical protein L3Y34_014199 [Caenorhabditis briggsae]|uniref:Uncharacterized protein n=1 Tax=Caenorhabditis briggsae TaxID=6238 RepID=A0AAE9DQ26_CAEBR|nr:hypothetical protein L3Y34_014199 [Caenorhabditis briggsae]